MGCVLGLTSLLCSLNSVDEVMGVCHSDLWTWAQSALWFGCGSSVFLKLHVLEFGPQCGSIKERWNLYKVGPRGD